MSAILRLRDIFIAAFRFVFTHNALELLIERCLVLIAAEGADGFEEAGVLVG